MKRLIILLAMAGVMTACVSNDKKSDESANGGELTGENKSLAENYYEAIQSGDEEAIRDFEQKIKALSPEEMKAVENRFNELKQEGMKAKPQTAKSLAQRMVEAENNEDYEAIDAILEEYYSLSYTEQKAADREYQRLCEEINAASEYTEYDSDYDYETDEILYDYDYEDNDYYDYSSNRGVELAQRAYIAYILEDEEALNDMDPEFLSLTESEQEAFEAEIYRLLSLDDEEYEYSDDEYDQVYVDDYYEYDEVF